MIHGCARASRWFARANRVAGGSSGGLTATGSNSALCWPRRRWRRQYPCTSAHSTTLRCRTSCPFPTNSTFTPSRLQQGETFDASVDAQNAGSGLTSLLRVFDANGTPLALDNQLGGDPQLTFQASTAGTYYIGVSSAPNNNYNPTVTVQRRPRHHDGAYTLNVNLTTSAPLLPDLTGSSFRTGVDMAAAGDTVPVSFTVQNRGGADPGNFQVQVLLSDSNLFPSSSLVLATFTRAATGDRRDRPRLFVAGRLQRDAAGRLDLGPGLHRPAHRGGPAGARGRPVRQERRPSRLGLGAADGRHSLVPPARPTCRRSITGLYTEIERIAGREPGERPGRSR